MFLLFSACFLDSLFFFILQFPTSQHKHPTLLVVYFPAKQQTFCTQNFPHKVLDICNVELSDVMWCDVLVHFHNKISFFLLYTQMCNFNFHQKEKSLLFIFITTTRLFISPVCKPWKSIKIIYNIKIFMFSYVVASSSSFSLFLFCSLSRKICVFAFNGLQEDVEHCNVVQYLFSFSNSIYQ